MGGSLDRSCIRRTCCRDQVDDQSPPELDPFPTSLVLCSRPCFHHFIPRLCVARERADYQHRIHGTAFHPYLSSKLNEYVQAIALFNMVRLPLNIIPTWIVQMLQASTLQNLGSYSTSCISRRKSLLIALRSISMKTRSASKCPL